jgi:hypothetical protein
MHEGKPFVGKRSDQRNIGSIPIVCRLFSSSCDETIDGVILNFGSNGFYAELKAQVNPGTVIAVRMNGISLGCSIVGTGGVPYETSKINPSRSAASSPIDRSRISGRLSLGSFRVRTVLRPLRHYSRGSVGSGATNDRVS